MRNKLIILPFIVCLFFISNSFSKQKIHVYKDNGFDNIILDSTNITKSQKLLINELRKKLGDNSVFNFWKSNKYYFQVVFNEVDLELVNGKKFDFEGENRDNEFRKLIDFIHSYISSNIKFKLPEKPQMHKTYFQTFDFDRGNKIYDSIDNKNRQHEDSKKIKAYSAEFDQFYKGIKVWNGYASINYGVTKVIIFTSVVYNDIKLDIKKISSFDTVFKKFKEKNNSFSIKKHRLKELYRLKELRIYHKPDKDGNNIYKACWYFLYFNDIKRMDHRVYLDAKNGEIFFEKWSGPK